MNMTLLGCVGLSALGLVAGQAFADEPGHVPAKQAEPATPGPADTSPLVHEGIINAPPEEVWKVFSTPEGFKAFQVAHCDMDFRIGGLIRTHYDPKGVLGDEGTINNMIVAFDPGRMLTIRIHQPPKNFPFKDVWKDTWSVITLTDLGDGRTHLRFSGNGYTNDPESQKMRAFFKAGNDWSMKKLQSTFDASKKDAVPAQVHAEGELSPLVVEQVVAMNKADAWRLLTTSAGWKQFMGVQTDIDMRPGGKFEVYFSMQPPAGERGSEGCTVLSVLPERMFSFSWNAPPTMAFARTQHTWVVVELTEVNPTSTRVTLTQLGFDALAKQHSDHAEDFKKCRAYFSQAWPKVLGALARVNLSKADGK